MRLSCHRGRGRWVALVRDGGEERLVEGRRNGTTGNELEVLAGAELLAELPEAEPVTFFAPSDYLRLGASEWLAAWRRRGWRTAGGKAVKNQSAWQALSRQLAGRTVHWRESSEEPEVRKRLDQALRSSKGAETSQSGKKRGGR
ncbi:MAG: RNase H family protein [Acidobacteriota bacterium]